MSGRCWNFLTDCFIQYNLGEASEYQLKPNHFGGLPDFDPLPSSIWLRNRVYYKLLLALLRRPKVNTASCTTPVMQPGLHGQKRNDGKSHQKHQSQQKGSSVTVFPVARPQCYTAARHS
jgi:hypothetical protein